MTHYDFAVQLHGKTMRFIGAGNKGALFEKDGTQLSVTVEEPTSGGIPTLLDSNGVLLPIRKVAKPCSCRGGIWKARPSELVAKL